MPCGCQVAGPTCWDRPWSSTKSGCATLDMIHDTLYFHVQLWWSLVLCPMITNYDNIMNWTCITIIIIFITNSQSFKVFLKSIMVFTFRHLKATQMGRLLFITIWQMYHLWRLKFISFPAHGTNSEQWGWRSMAAQVTLHLLPSFK